MGQRLGLKFSLLTLPVQIAKHFAPMGSLKTLAQYFAFFFLSCFLPSMLWGRCWTPMLLLYGRNREGGWGTAALPRWRRGWLPAKPELWESQLGRQELLCHLTALHSEKGRSNRKVNKVIKWCYDFDRLLCISAELYVCKDYSIWFSWERTSYRVYFQ